MLRRDLRFCHAEQRPPGARDLLDRLGQLQRGEQDGRDEDPDRRTNQGETGMAQHVGAGVRCTDGENEYGG